MVNQAKFGARVTKRREQRGLSIQELAERIGITYQSLWRIEHGKQGDVGLSTVANLARELGVSIDYLAGLYEDKDSERLPAEQDLVPA